ncbi:MAG: carboxypeptidase-like regulatory domain-containing protein [Crocinitomicaceae bacterium]|nr:carboxypeptidase-like regulatory domain-containing protein [Crocinitomicaceae bacterium]
MKRITSIIGILLGGAILLSSCQKEGPGGTSSISGNVSGEIITGNSGGSAEKEVTTVICTHANGIDGSILDNSDYFLLNTPDGGTYYYVWYENTNWLGQDPSLSGRTGIKVTYSNNDSNLTIAGNTAVQIAAIAGTDFTVEVINDIVTITNTAVGEVPDADEVNTPFIVDVANQGKSAAGGSSSTIEAPIADERVYIIYGDEDTYSESVRTDADGNYQFKGLTKGDYTVFAFSVNTSDPNGLLMQVEQAVTITDNKQVVTAPELTIVQ